MGVFKTATDLLQHVVSWEDAIFIQHNETVKVIITTSLNFDIFVNGRSISLTIITDLPTDNMMYHFT